MGALRNILFFARLMTMYVTRMLALYITAYIGEISLASRKSVGKRLLNRNFISNGQGKRLLPLSDGQESFRWNTKAMRAALAILAGLCAGLAAAVPLGLHPCDAPDGQLYELVCDYNDDGRSFFFCTLDPPVRLVCGPHQRFNNALQACDWDYNTDCLPPSGVLTTPATPPQTTRAASTTVRPATTRTSRTTTTTTGAKTTTTRTTTTRKTTPTWKTTTAVPVSGPCNDLSCQLPDCRCISTNVPANLPVADIPQMVLVTFDDSINNNNLRFYNQLFPADRNATIKNPNGCPIKATFFVSGDNNNDQAVKAIAGRGHEMASHSRDHSDPSGWSSQAWYNQIQGMREDLASITGISVGEIKGMRAPFLQMGREVQYSMIRDANFLYDSSMYGGSLQDDGAWPVWPFSLKYPPTLAVCDSDYCPKNSYPELWEVPLIRQYTVRGEPCSMTDACALGWGASEQDVIDFLQHNFDRHYTTNRAPLMISLHATWFDNVPRSLQGLKRFLQSLAQKNDVYMVSVSQAIEWVRHPVVLSSASQFTPWQC